MRPRIKKGVLITSTSFARRAQARRLEIEILYTPKILGASIISRDILAIK